MSLSGAIHLCTGQPEDGARIDAWLAAHGVSIHRCADPMRLCVMLLRQPELAPELALLGGAGLQGDDWSILRYLKETWPHIGVIAYGDSSLRVPEPSLLTCRTEAEWQHILGGTPQALLASIRQGPGTPTQKPHLDVTGIPAPTDPLDGALTAQELSDLLERQGDV